jgi:hypothetical protein
MLDWNLPYLTEEHKSLVGLMKEFCQREVDLKKLNEMADVPIPPNATSAQLRERMPWDLISKAHDAGIRQIAAPEEFGGGGYGEDHLGLAAMGETAGYYGGHFGRLNTITWKQLAAFAYTSKDLAEEVLGDFMRDRKTMMGASITEPNSGSDFLMPYDEPGATGNTSPARRVTSGSSTATRCSARPVVSPTTSRSWPERSRRDRYRRASPSSSLIRGGPDGRLPVSMT